MEGFSERSSTMTRFLAILLLFCVLSGFLCGCTPNAVQPEASFAGSAVPDAAPSSTPEIKEEPIVTPAPTPASQNKNKLEVVPNAYYKTPTEPGTLEEFYYDTYESVTYAEKKTILNKRAIVYLPHGYTEEKQYNILYLMHGGWSNETTSLGTPDYPSGLKVILDNAIADGCIDPLIVVCPTYNNLSGEDSGDYTLAYYTLTVNYHNELKNDLIPAIESRYSTYAENTTAEGIIASRDHRAFAGFSMGSVTTWHTFINCLPQFRYFMPASGGVDYDGSLMDAAVEEAGYGPEDFFIFACTGTEDFACEGFVEKIRNLLNLPSGNFILHDNVEFYIKNGYAHDGTAATEYTFNGLQRIWGKKAAPEKAEAYPADTAETFTADTLIEDVMQYPAFGEFGRLLFPGNSYYYTGETLGELQMTWYSHIDPKKTVEIVNYMKEKTASGDTVFYDIYTEEEKKADPEKKNTGLFFFKGNPGERFAVCNAGGGFSYVGAMHDSFPHALELSKAGYNAFALIYRPDAQKACEDLARAITFIFEHAEELEVDTDCYSLWGGSAGARMAAYLGAYGSAAFGGAELPSAGTVVMQYTGHSEVSENDPPTYACVGTNDWIANWETMYNRLQKMEQLGIPTEFHAYNGLSHGFGLGNGTVANGWIRDAIAFWEAQM